MEASELYKEKRLEEQEQETSQAASDKKICLI